MGSKAPRWAVGAAALAVMASGASRATAQSPGAFERAEARMGMADFEDAAALFEESGGDATQDLCGPDAWSRGATLRMALGDPAQAVTDAARFEQACGAREPEAVVRLWLALADSQVAREAWREAVGAASRAARWADRTRSRELQTIAHARRARMLLLAGDGKQADEEVAKLLARDGGPATTPATPDGAQALAEARFVAATRVREKQKPIVIPAYVGDRSSPSIQAYARRVGSSIAQKWYGAIYAEAAFSRVFGVTADVRPCSLTTTRVVSGDGRAELFRFQSYECDAGDFTYGALRLDSSERPLDAAWRGAPPSLRWAIASAAAIGTLWLDVANTERAFPTIRPDLDPRLKPGVFVCGGPDPPSVVAAARANAAFAACVRFSAAGGIADAVPACDEGLERSHVHGLPRGTGELVPRVRATPVARELTDRPAPPAITSFALSATP
jgi:hypothetical protein